MTFLEILIIIIVILLTILIAVLAFHDFNGMFNPLQRIILIIGFFYLSFYLLYTIFEKRGISLSEVLKALKK